MPRLWRMFNFLKTHRLLWLSDFYISTINYFIVRTKKAIFSFSKILVAVSFLVLMWPSGPPSASKTLLLPSRVTGGWCPPAGRHHHCSVFLTRSLKRSVECCPIRVYMFLYISVSPTEPENQGSLPAYHWTQTETVPPNMHPIYENIHYKICVSKNIHKWHIFIQLNR